MNEKLVPHLPHSSSNSACSSDLRQACIATSDHELFTQLNLGHIINSKDESLRRFLDCPPDEAQVLSFAGDTPNKNQFSASFCIRMFQKRLHANPTRELGMEFIFGGMNHNPRRSWC
ncbi:hypothetical protein BDR04DRAFT_1098510 [Suillus decipiens]|nr:hypothetical protein BDR04DRAFT_1098510 [Suillus decipiens]